MPQMGYDMTEGTMVRWVKKVGDRVHRGDVVAEIETDKATVEIEAFESGTMLRIIAEPGQTLPVGQPIATIGEPGEELSELQPAPAPPAPTPAAPAPPAPTPPAPAPAPAAPSAARPPAPMPAPLPGRLAQGRAPGDRVPASPLARRLAAQLGVELSTIPGSGPGGRVVAADVEAAAQAGRAPAPAVDATLAPAPDPPSTAAAPRALPPLPEGAEDTEPSRLRQAIARRMSESKRSAPHFYVAVDIRADALLDLRQALAAKKTKVSVNDLLVKALALATVAHPAVNAAYLEGTIRRFATVDVGIAVATDNGLLSPAIRDVAGKTLKEIAAATADLAERARAGHLKPEEYGGGTVTLSNLGMYGVDEFLAIINPPQALIVSVGAAAERVVPVKGKPGIAKVLTAWAAADHRVLDGAQVGEFMRTFRSLVEDPSPLTV